MTIANPPAVAAGYVDLYVPGPGGARNGVALAAAGGKTQWDIVAETDQPNTPVTVTWPDLSRVPGGLAVTLRDADTNRAVNMRTCSAYAFTSGPAGAQRHLQLEVTPRSTCAALVTAMSAKPVGSGVQITYVLSAAADVDIEVTNMPAARWRGCRVAARSPVRRRLNGRDAVTAAAKCPRAIPGLHPLQG